MLFGIILSRFRGLGEVVEGEGEKWPALFFIAKRPQSKIFHGNHILQVVLL